MRQKHRRIAQAAGHFPAGIGAAAAVDGYDMDKNAVQRVESGQRFVTDIEVEAFAKVFGVSLPMLFSESFSSVFLSSENISPEIGFSENISSENISSENISSENDSRKEIFGKQDSGQ